MCRRRDKPSEVLSLANSQHLQIGHGASNLMGLLSEHAGTWFSDTQHIGHNQGYSKTNPVPRDDKATERPTGSAPAESPSRAFEGQHAHKSKASSSFQIKESWPDDDPGMAGDFEERCHLDSNCAPANWQHRECRDLPAYQLGEKQGKSTKTGLSAMKDRNLGRKHERQKYPSSAVRRSRKPSRLSSRQVG